MTERDEVRYHMLRPTQVVARRTECPIAYVPLGTLEWHGPQNPLGADTLQAEALAEAAARRGGGLVLPALYYGESRLESLMEANADDRDDIASAMELDPENFTAARHPFSATEQTLNYQKLLLHILAEVESLGFEVGVLVAGHYPLVVHAQSAVLLFNRRTWSRYHGMLAWATVDFLLARDRWPEAGDHAARWETSHLMHHNPETVDLSTLPPEGQPLVGIAGQPPQQATAEFGKQTLDYAADKLVKEAHHRLAHPECYRGHGATLLEGLWKDEG